MLINIEYLLKNEKSEVYDKDNGYEYRIVKYPSISWIKWVSER